MRQTGRTSRIINHVVTQLFEVGQCISTDHTIFEYGKISNINLHYFIDKVKERINFLTNRKHSVKTEIVNVEADGNSFKVVYFKLLKNNEDEQPR